MTVVKLLDPGKGADAHIIFSSAIAVLFKHTFIYCIKQCHWPRMGVCVMDHNHTTHTQHIAVGEVIHCGVHTVPTINQNQIQSEQ